MSGHQRQAGNASQLRRGAVAAGNAATSRDFAPAHFSGGKRRPLASIKNLSVIRAFAILKAFHSPDEWVAACDLSRRAMIPEATVNRFMQSLMDVGAVVRDEEGKYRCVLFVMPGIQAADTSLGLRR